MSVLGTPNVWVPVLLLLAAAPTAWLGLAAWQRRRAPGATPLALTALAAAIWCGLAAIEISSQNTPVRLFLASLEYICQALLPVLWLLVVVEFTGRERHLRRALPWLFVIPTVTLALVISNRWQGWQLPLSAPASADFWAEAQNFYTYLMLVASFSLLVIGWLAAASPQRGQLTMLLACMLVPLAWIAVGTFQPAAGGPFVAMPVALAFSALIVVWALFSFRPFDVSPLAHAAVMANLSDAVVVVGLDQRIADYNPAAGRLLGWAGREACGQLAQPALAAWDELAASLWDEPPLRELSLGLGADRRIFTLSLDPLADAYGRPMGQLLTLRDTTEHHRLEDELARLSTTDDVTGLPDHRRLSEALGDELRRARRYEAPLALLLLDLDHFKALNDQFGRQTGDEALRAVARAMQRLARQSDVPARQGSDEFVLILPHTNLLGAETVAGRLAAAVNQVQLSRPASLSLSVGAVELDADDDERGESLLARAEKALSAAREAGGGRVMVEEKV